MSYFEREALPVPHIQSMGVGFDAIFQVREDLILRKLSHSIDRQVGDYLVTFLPIDAAKLDSSRMDTIMQATRSQTAASGKPVSFLIDNVLSGFELRLSLQDVKLTRKVVDRLPIIDTIWCLNLFAHFESRLSVGGEHNHFGDHNDWTRLIINTDALDLGSNKLFHELWKLKEIGRKLKNKTNITSSDTNVLIQTGLATLPMKIDAYFDRSYGEVGAKVASIESIEVSSLGIFDDDIVIREIVNRLNSAVTGRIRSGLHVTPQFAICGSLIPGESFDDWGILNSAYPALSIKPGNEPGKPCLFVGLATQPGAVAQDIKPFVDKSEFACLISGWLTRKAIEISWREYGGFKTERHVPLEFSINERSQIGTAHIEINITQLKSAIFDVGYNGLTDAIVLKCDFGVRLLGAFDEKGSRLSPEIEERFTKHEVGELVIHAHLFDPALASIDPFLISMLELVFSRVCQPSPNANLVIDDAHLSAPLDALIFRGSLS